MANEKIYNKRCFIKRADGKAFCSKCGQIVMQDSYNMKKHAEKCGFAEQDFVKIYRENKDFVCAWKGTEDKLILVVYTPKLKLRPGFSDKYVGGTWEPVYKCALGINEKSIQELKGGLRTLDFWKVQEMDSLNRESSYEIVNKYFHIPGYKDLSTFVDIYKGKGYSYNQRLTDEEARSVLMGEALEENGAFDFLQQANKREAYITGKLVYIQNQKEPILRLDVHASFSTKVFKMLIAQDYFFSEDRLNVKKLLQEQFWTFIEDDELATFDKYYPKFGLMNYWKVSKRNILIPLLAPNYDDSLELLSKAGCGNIANHFYLHKAFNSEKLVKCGDIKKWLGVPVKVLRRVQEEWFQIEDFLDILSETYKKAPEYLEVGGISYSVLRFLKGNVLPGLKNRDTDIDGFSDLHKKIKLRISRYLGQSTGVEWQYNREYGMYVDYLNMSRANAQYFAGYTPRDLRQAHDMAMNAYRQKHNEIQVQKFIEKVSEKEYRCLESEYKKDAGCFVEDEYIIRAPRGVGEMNYESSKLHHCVRIYIDSVIHGRTKIYFLREKNNPDEPYATIEVSGNGVRQLKAICNRKAPKEAQEFVKKWAKIKGLYIASGDLI